MKRNPIRRTLLAAAGLGMILAAGCTAIPDSAIDKAALDGWDISSSGSGKVFACVPPSCPSIRVAVHERVSMSAQERAFFDTANANTRSLLADEFRSAFEPYAQLDDDKFTIVGDAQALRVAGRKAFGLRLGSRQPAGTLTKDGYLILIPSGSTLHIVVGVGATSAVARTAARQVADALAI